MGWPSATKGGCLRPLDAVGSEERSRGWRRKGNSRRSGSQCPQGTGSRGGWELGDARSRMRGWADARALKRVVQRSLWRKKKEAAAEESHCKIIERHAQRVLKAVQSNKVSRTRSVRQKAPGGAGSTVVSAGRLAALGCRGDAKGDEKKYKVFWSLGDCWG